MREDYFKEVIYEISQLCREIRDKEHLDESSNELKVENLYYNASEIKFLEEFGSYDKKLEEYLFKLSDKTINVICALMDFGRNYSGKVLPINLNDFFNRYYLSYWFNKNENENKKDTVNYLGTKSKRLDEYLNRAEYLLFYSKDVNINFKCECGGSLCLQESDGIEQIDYNEYTLHLKCLKCGVEVSKYVDKDFLNKSI